MTLRTAAPALSLLLTAALAPALGCADPVGDAPRAEVKEAAPKSAPAADSALPADTVRYSFSSEGSRLDFVGAKVTKTHDGGFKKFSGTLDVPRGDLSAAKVDVEIDVASIFTDNPKLTGHLQGPDFFHVAQFPTARFVSSTIKPGAEGTSTVTGELTLHGVTKSISFPARVEAGADKATVKAEFGINRKDFGIVYPGAPDDLIKDEVLLKIDVHAKPAAS